MLDSARPGSLAVAMAMALLAAVTAAATPGRGVTDSAVPLSQQDLGVSMLALVDNARFAIARRDVVAAVNDVSEAQSLARNLPIQPSKLIPPKEANGVTDFDALVQLNSSRAELGKLRFKSADADLRRIQKGIPRAAVPRTLPLLSAAASLDLARTAAINGRTGDLKTQLMTARHFLRQYAGSQHPAARRLAAQIGKLLAQRRRSAVLPYRLSDWASQVCGWAGSERWGAGPSQ
jgi:hypothetical protein